MADREKYIAGLKDMGYVETYTPAPEFVCLMKTGASPLFFFVGRRSALLYAQLRRIDSSVCASAATRLALVRRADSLIDPL